MVEGVAVEGVALPGWKELIGIWELMVAFLCCELIIECFFSGNVSMVVTMGSNE